MSVDPALFERLWHAHAAGRVDPREFPALDVAEGQTLQVALIDRLRGDGRLVGGWKLGLTSGAGRDSFGAGVRPFGFVLAERIHSSGAALALSDIVSCGLENELCFVIDTPLGAGSTAADARAAIRGVAPAFEVNQHRLTGRASPGLAVADNLSQWGLVVGAPVELPLTFDFEALIVTLERDGEPVQTVSARYHIDDHFESLACLANGLARHGLALEPGHRVITGSFTRQPVREPGCWSGRFGAPFADVTLTLR